MANRIFTVFIAFLMMWVSLEAASTGFLNRNVLKSCNNGDNITRFDTNGGMSISFLSDRNEVIIHGSPEKTEAALRQIDEKVTSLNVKYRKLSTAFKSLDGKMLVLLKAVTDQFQQRLDALNKTNGELLQKIQAMEISQEKGYTLLFPRRGTNDHVAIRNIPSLSAVTFCLWMKSADSGNSGTPLSYSVPGNDNELLLYNYQQFRLFVKGEDRQTSVSANDGKWHHICAAWASTAGSWKLYKDGKVAASGQNLKTGHVILAGGFLVLGQEQDSLGGGFEAHQSFIGELTSVDIWNRVLSNNEILNLSKSCSTGQGNVVKWADFRPHTRGAVRFIHTYCNA